MEIHTAPAEKVSKRFIPPPKPRIAPGVGDSPLLAVRVGADRVEKVKANAEKAGKTTAEYLRWLIDILPES